MTNRILIPYISDPVETEVAFVGKISDEIICLRYKDNVKVELEHAKEIEQINLKISGHTPFQILSDARSVHISPSKEARQYFSDVPNAIHLVNSCAVLFDGTGMRLLVKLFMKFNQPSYPMDYFNHLDPALGWLALQWKKEEVKNLTL